MKVLKPQFKKVLQSVVPISNTAIISFPETCVRSGKSIMAFIDVEKLGEEKFDDFGLYMIDDLLSVSSLVVDGECELKEGVLEFSNSNTKVRYNTSNVEILKENFEGDFELIDRIKGNEKVGEFKLSSSVMKELKMASNALKNLPNLIVKLSTEAEFLISGNEKSSNSYSTKGEGKGEVEFSMSLNDLKKIPNGNFDVEVYQNKKGSLVMILNSEDIDGLRIVSSITKA